MASRDETVSCHWVSTLTSPPWCMPAWQMDCVENGWVDLPLSAAALGACRNGTPPPFISLWEVGFPACSPVRGSVRGLVYVVAAQLLGYGVVRIVLPDGPTLSGGLGKYGRSPCLSCGDRNRRKGDALVTAVGVCPQSAGKSSQPTQELLCTHLAACQAPASFTGRESGWLGP